MTKKKNRLFTFFCSLIPGAGEMYLGFFKHGLSVMTLFFLLMFFSSMLFPPLMFLAPVLWFYSFFHVNHLITLPDDEFYMIEDDYFFHVDRFIQDSEPAAYQIPKSYFLCLNLFRCGDSVAKSQ